MPDTAKARELLDRYLVELAGGLRSLPKEQVTEIRRELESHVLDRAGEPITEAGVRAALAALGEADALAAQYLTQNLFERASLTRSPWLLLQSLFHWATLSVKGFCVAVCSAIAYLLGVCLLAAAAMKPFESDRVGLWSLKDADDHTYSLSLGIGPAHPQGLELLGWWIIPLGILLGACIVVLTYRYDLRALRDFRRDWQRRHFG